LCGNAAISCNDAAKATPVPQTHDQLLRNRGAEPPFGETTSINQKYLK
jgi:hypothetical protein